MTDTVVSVAFLAVTHLLSFWVMTEPKYTTRKTLFVYSAFFALFVGTTLLLYRFSGVGPFYYLFGYISTIVLAFLIFVFTSSDPFCKKLFLFVSYANVFSILGSFSILICNTFFKNRPYVFVHYATNIVRTVLFIPIILVYIRFLRPVIRSVSGSRRKAWYSISVVSLLFLTVFALFMIMFYIKSGSADTYSLLFAVSVIIYCSTLWVFFGTIKSMLNESNTELTKRNVIYLQEQLKSANEKELYAKTIRHDFRHHSQNVALMLQDGKTDEALLYIKHYCQSLNEAKSNDFCPNVTVNAILNGFCKRAREEGIAVSVFADTQADTAVKDMDFVAILSNLLENALNGCNQQEKNAKITVNIRTIGDKTVIVCSNTCKTEIEIENGLPKQKGIGIASMQIAARKYNGDIAYTFENGVLTVCVILKA